MGKKDWNKFPFEFSDQNLLNIVIVMIGEVLKKKCDKKLLTVVEKIPISGWEVFHCVCKTKENTILTKAVEKIK